MLEWVSIPFAPKYEMNIFTNSVREVGTHRKKKRDINRDGIATYSFWVGGQLMKYKPYELREIVMKGGEYYG